MSEETKDSIEAVVDPTASVHPSAEMAPGVVIGPYTVIGESVKIGKNTRIHSHAVIDKWTTIGADCEIFPFVSIGAPPQDLGYKGEKTEVIIGDRNVIREFVTIHRATTKEEKRTVIGNDNMFMNYVHVAHDCRIGNHVIMANAATLAGHVDIEDHAIVGGIVAVHQHVRIGAYCIIGGASAVSKDIPPYVMAVGNRARLYKLNSVGLKRHGFSKEALKELNTIYKMLFCSTMTRADAIAFLKTDMPDSIYVKEFIDFIERSKRGVSRAKLKVKSGVNEED